MTNEEQFRRLLEKEKRSELIPFLKSLTDGDRKALAPAVKKLAKDYLKYELEGNSFKQKATDKQQAMFALVAFVCYSRTDFEKANFFWRFGKQELEPILSWYCPSWFSDFINGTAERNWMPNGIDYDYLVDLAERNLLQITPLLVAKQLPQVVFEHEYKVVNNRTVSKLLFKPEMLVKHAITLQEHIWYLFQQESIINYARPHAYFQGKEMEEDTGWINVFKKYVAEGKLDRQRVLQESLLASNRNFNKNMSGWFATLFQQLQPTKEESLSLQPELFVLFSSPHGKVVNTALQSCKELVLDTGFNVDSFLDYVPMLIASSTKSVVSNALQLLEKLARQYPDKRPAICLLISGTFLHKDEALQAKAAKLIVKFGDAKDKYLQETIRQYSNSFFANTRQLLQPFLLAETSPTNSTQAESQTERKYIPPLLSAQALLTPVEDVDELVFLCSQAFDNNQSYHFDQVLAAIVHLQNVITAKQVHQLNPAFQRAFKTFYGDWRTGIGQLDHLLSHLFLDFGAWLMRKYPAATGELNTLYTGFMNKQEHNKTVWAAHGAKATFMVAWKPQEESLYTPHKKLCDLVLSRLADGQDAPLLSTPTHAPAWIDPKVLVERIHQYQQRQLAVDTTDMQVALSRCWLHQTEEAVVLVKEKIEGEVQQLLLFLLQENSEPQGPFTQEWMWMTAALCKGLETIYPPFESLSYYQKNMAVYTGQYPWKTGWEEYQRDKPVWNGSTLSYTKETARRKVIRLDFSEQQAPTTEKQNVFQKWWTKLAGKATTQQPESEPLLYDFLRFKGQWIWSEMNDIRRLMMLVPNNPEPLVSITVDKCLSDPDFFGETNKKFVVATLQALHDIWKLFGEMAHLLVATSMLCGDKTAAAYAAEIWLRGVEEASIDSALIGIILGKHESVEYAPLKRLTDLIVVQMLNVSPLHNQALKQLLSAMLKQLPEVPIRNQKKLVSIYNEVVLLTGSVSADKVLSNTAVHNR